MSYPRELDDGRDGVGGRRAAGPARLRRVLQAPPRRDHDPEPAVADLARGRTPGCWSPRSAPTPSATTWSARWSARASRSASAGSRPGRVAELLVLAGARPTSSPSRRRTASRSWRSATRADEDLAAQAAAGQGHPRAALTRSRPVPGIGYSGPAVRNASVTASSPPPLVPASQRFSAARPWNRHGAGSTTTSNRKRAHSDAYVQPQGERDPATTGSSSTPPTSCSAGSPATPPRSSAASTRPPSPRTSTAATSSSSSTPRRSR